MERSRPEVIKSIIPKTRASGFADRFLYSAEMPFAKRHNFSKKINKGFYNDYVAFIKELSSRIDGMENFYFEMPEELLDFFEDTLNDYWKLKQSDEMEGGMVSYISKLETYVPRFILVFAVIDWIMEGSTLKDFEVKKQHIVNAKLATDYFFKTGRKLFDKADDSLEADEIIRRAGVKTKKAKAIALVEAGWGDKAAIVEKSGMAKQNFSRDFEQIGKGFRLKK